MALSALVTLLVLAALIDVIGATTAWGGALLAIWVWVGFILTTTSSTVLFEGRNPTTYWLAVGYYFVLLVPAGAFLASWS